MQQQLHQLSENLLSGGWSGRGATAFQTEIESEVYPAYTRLVAALQEAQQVTFDIVQTWETADDEAARPFAQESGGIETYPNGTTSPMPPIEIENATPDTMEANPASSGSWLRPNDAEVNELFSDDGMGEIIGYSHPIAYLDVGRYQIIYT